MVTNSPPVDPKVARLALLGTQMSVMVHEMRQPLFVLKAMLDLEERKVNSQAPEFLPSIRAQVDSLENLITQYGRLGRMPEVMQRFDLNVPVAEAAEWMRQRASQYGVRFRTEMTDSILHVIACPTSTQQVAFNLLQNAYEAVGQGPGTGDVILRTRVHGEWVRLEVEDTGGGLSDTLLEPATKPFVTSKEAYGGTGLGLYVVKSIVEGANGQFRLVNIDRGMRAEVDLPKVA